MQIFISSDFKIENDNIIVKDERIVYQLLKVLRAKVGYNFIIKNFLDSFYLSYHISLININKSFVLGKIISKNSFELTNNTNGIIISMLNNFSKLELITQKLSEIGIQNIVYWQSSRSVLKEINDNKMQRLKKISLEAIEQSNGNLIPNIMFLKYKEIIEFIIDKKILYFDKEGLNITQIEIQPNSKTFFVIGPEGGFSIDDLRMLHSGTQNQISLGSSILRSETAAIIGGWILNNFY